MQEEWRTVIGWEGIYEVSNFGNVKRIIELPNSPPAGLLSPIKSRAYMSVSLMGVSMGKKRKRIPIHELVLNAFIGPKPTKNHEAAHWDGNGSNNNITNLRWATHKENHADNLRLNRTARGNRLPHTKLTESDVIHIRHLCKNGFIQRSIAKAWGITQSSVSSIYIGKNWQHIPMEAV